ncbi:MULTISPECIES: hypothetical protein [Sphingomonadaceae]|uniref:hypothetical protein n=1 Tax=Sphingomonadales TaxID=204457 RepID=UPI00076FFDC0|nr:hypothetical protein [Sphingobium sp. TKS]AMK23245.1 hypothetical protein K426_11545 [Sphingobium sp. TKS]MCF8709079.1 hypothetical protein [Rhizorhapis sp. SPR117]
MTARRHFVHVYATIRVKVAVDAINHTEAIRAADRALFDKGFAVRLIPNARDVLDAEYAEEVVGYMVDEAGDPTFEHTRNYDNNYQPEGSAG